MKNNKGVTLIALIITIIVLLLLAGIGITMVVGQNGILSRAQEAKTTTAEKAAREKVDLSVSGAITRSNYGELTIENLKEEIGKYGGTMIGDEFPVTVTMDGYEFTVNGRGNVTKPGDPISKDESYVGYYADIDADGTVDGVIYADLAIGGSGTWFTGDGSAQAYKNNGTYTIPKANNIDDLKGYYISQTNYNGNDANGKGFGKRDVISPTGTGTDRFYIMALTDIDGQINGTYYDWYSAAYYYNNNKGMKDFASTTFIGFGKGKTNTATMISKWNTESYGDKNQCSDGHLDMWGQIQTQVNNGWFVPSKEEWEAFAGELGISENSSNEKYYGNFGLSSSYWSSSQGSADGAWYAIFEMGFMVNYDVNDCNCVRLSATF